MKVVSQDCIKIFVYFLFSVLLLASKACKEDDVLPALTHEGKNTFGCYVNGEVWEPFGKIGSSGLLVNLAKYSKTDTLFIDIAATNLENISGFHLNFTDKDSIQLNKPYSFGANIPVYSEKGENGLCDYDSIIDGYIELSYLSVKEQIIAGKFEFTAYSANCDKEVKVTDGRFDIGLIYYTVFE